jgi:hypothetical protein
MVQQMQGGVGVVCGFVQSSVLFYYCEYSQLEQQAAVSLIAAEYYTGFPHFFNNQ